MIVYSATRREFTDDVCSNQIESRILDEPETDAEELYGQVALAVLKLFPEEDVIDLRVARQRVAKEYDENVAKSLPTEEVAEQLLYVKDRSVLKMGMMSSEASEELKRFCGFALHAFPHGNTVDIRNVAELAKHGNEPVSPSTVWGYGCLLLTLTYVLSVRSR